MSHKISRLPLVTIISVNYNQEEVTRELLFSIRKLSYPNLEVIVVDNGSQTNLVSSLGNQFSEFTFIRSDKNLGFAGGNNLGIENARGEFIFFINNDTILTPNTIEPLLEKFTSEKNVGVVSPKIKYFEDPELIQYAGYTAMNPYTARNKGIGNLEKDNGQYDLSTETFFAHGAAMMIKREVIDKVGVMPEIFFLYYEEFDWCEQIRKAGYRIFYEPKSVIFHKESISVGKNSTLKTYYMSRNRILFMRRNYSGAKLYFFFIYMIFVVFPKEISKHLLSKEQEHVLPLIKGYFWNLKKHS
jgi:GT2 family glycosyltransferase